MTTITIEHLELAALAAGHVTATFRQRLHWRGPAGWTPWRPHRNIADAAQLALRLDLWASTYGKVAFAAEDPGVQRSSCRHVRHDGTEPDKLRAYCEAVTLCAAEIGRRMREGGR